jgi:hypothetical protein
MKAGYSQETMLKETAVKILTRGLLLEVKETLPKELTFSVAVLPSNPNLANLLFAAGL